MLSNLFASAPPFQMDGNLGTSSAIAEMLLQSGDNEISLIPAIPAKWKAEGSFRGLKSPRRIYGRLWMEKCQGNSLSHLFKETVPAMDTVQWRTERNYFRKNIKLKTCGLGFYTSQGKNRE